MGPQNNDCISCIEATREINLETKSCECRDGLFEVEG